MTGGGGASWRVGIRHRTPPPGLDGRLRNVGLQPSSAGGPIRPRRSVQTVSTPQRASRRARSRSFTVYASMNSPAALIRATSVASRWRWLACSETQPGAAACSRQSPRTRPNSSPRRTPGATSRAAASAPNRRTRTTRQQRRRCRAGPQPRRFFGNQPPGFDVAAGTGLDLDVCRNRQFDAAADRLRERRHALPRETRSAPRTGIEQGQRV